MQFRRANTGPVYGVVHTPVHTPKVSLPLGSVRLGSVAVKVATPTSVSVASSSPKSCQLVRRVRTTGDVTAYSDAVCSGARFGGLSPKVADGGARLTPKIAEAGSRVDTARALLAQIPRSIGAAGSNGTVLCFGDSLTKGIEATGGSYPVILEGLLKDAGFNLNVHNTGVWGETVEQLAVRFPYVLADAAKRGRLVCVLVLGGTNDIIRGGFYASQLLGRLKSLHEMAGAAPGEPSVGVLTIPPAQLSDVKDRARLLINKGLRDACRSVPASSRQFLVDLEDVDFNLCYDGLHYAVEGYQDFASRAFQAMRPRLQVL